MSNPYDNARDENSSVLGPTLKFKGELSADEDLLIKGRVEGSIRHSSSLTIGEGGHVKANVAAEYIAVEGRVEGDLNGSKCVKIRKTAKIDGNIVSPSVSLVDGAKFNGKIDMDSDPTAKHAGKPAERPVEDAVAAPEKAAATETDESSADANQGARKKRPAASKPKSADKKPANAA
ncbi:MAG: polymer-forming cytoskeletal protein [Woeseiaceae bacterium]|jgi:cytoskeletal protein CcmA (bactofilin family)